MNLRFAPVIALLILSLVISSFSIEKIIGLEMSYNLALILIGSTFSLGILRLYPFNAAGSIEWKFKEMAIYILLLAWPISCVNAMLQRGEILFWYPTDHRLWAAAPIFLIGAIAWFKGVRVGKG